MTARVAARGRGRLSAIELLPPHCDPVIAWAANELRDRDRTQTDIYTEFVSRLETLKAEHRGELEFDIPSMSAFNRYSIRLATMTRRIEETGAIATAIAGKFDPKKSDDLTVIAAEAIKTLVFEVLTAAGEHGIDPKGAMQLANALRSAAQAQNVSTARRVRADREFGEQVNEAVEAVRREKGMSAETAERIKSMILGIAPPGEKGAGDDSE